MQKYKDTVINRNGQVVTAATVTVSRVDEAEAVIYSDNGVTIAANPISVDGNGYFEFYAADGHYSITIEGSNFPSITIEDILLEDDDARIDALEAAVAALGDGTGVWGGISGTLGDQTDLAAVLNAKAAKASPVFTGNPTGPTQSPGNNSLSLATTAYVDAAVTAGTVSDGDKGDITVSGSGAVWAIDNDAVTYAKMQNVGANSVLARAAGTSGDLSEIALAASQLLGRGASGDVAPIVLGTGLSMSGTTLNSSGGGSTQGKHAIPIEAGSMEPDAGAPCEFFTRLSMGSGKPAIGYLAFDSGATERAQFVVYLDESWNGGTITFRADWSHPVTTTNFGVAWQLEAAAVGDNETHDQTWGTGVIVTDTGSTQNYRFLSDESTAVTIANTPGAKHAIHCRVSRIYNDAGDTMAVDARLHRVIVYITTDADTDV